MCQVDRHGSERKEGASLHRPRRSTFGRQEIRTPLPYLYDFDQADGSDTDLLGGKGAGLAEMTELGLPVPPGFIITTETCRTAKEGGSPPEGLWGEVAEAMRRLEAKTGRTFGGGPTPLLLSVRSGAKSSMPGMMDTILNLGMNDRIVESLAGWAGDPQFAWDAYRRFVQMFGNVVLGIDEHRFQEVLTEARRRRGAEDEASLSAADLEEVTRRFQEIVEEERPGELPEDPSIQLEQSIGSVFASWDNPRAAEYRRLNGIPDGLGTAATVQMMVFGDLGGDSGTGVCFTRDPGTGSSDPYGDYLPQSQGEDVVAGIRNTLTLDDLRELHPVAHQELLAVMETLEKHYRDMCDIEFTIERGELYILQTRVGKRTGEAAVRLAVAMVDEGLIDQRTAVGRVEPSALEQLYRPRISSHSSVTPVASGVAASPGAAVGRVAFSSEEAVRMAVDGGPVILVRPETTPEDIRGMAAAAGILTSHGGKTSHAAVVARGMGKPAVTGASGLMVDSSARVAHAGDVDIAAGDEITIDGTSGRVFIEPVELIEPDHIPELSRLLEWADQIRTLGVWANADTGEDARRARERGAAGIGLARTEHMFLGERLRVVQRVILATDADARDNALDELERQQVGDFEEILEAMDGLPVVIRLLDPPLHEFLPSRLELEQEALRRVRAGRPIDDLQRMSEQVARWEETNPMLGLRGVRLGLMLDKLYRMQARAAVTAAANRLAAGGTPRLEIMVPLVSTVEELRRMRKTIEEEIAVAVDAGNDLEVPVGTMIELPRAALTAGDIAKVADFFSFGTNDLTQMTFGLSRDDAEGLFLRDYLEQGILTSDPFQTLDEEGVGRLIRVAVKEGREANPELVVGLCGEHGGDPKSIAFVRTLGLDYVSCSPPRLEGARLAAAQAESGLDQTVDR
ncbi:MAG: pyruvate, phosphate dikinase, partial [Actinobacteria bacterium]|nr:pyruvate, phosphate dikinase [Actinomycetota bacterium]